MLRFDGIASGTVTMEEGQQGVLVCRSASTDGPWRAGSPRGT